MMVEGRLLPPVYFGQFHPRRRYAWLDCGCSGWGAQLDVVLSCACSVLSAKCLDLIVISNFLLVLLVSVVTLEWKLLRLGWPCSKTILWLSDWVKLLQQVVLVGWKSRLALTTWAYEENVVVEVKSTAWSSSLGSLYETTYINSNKQRLGFGGHGQ
jgi:hypothetical protein